VNWARAFVTQAEIETEAEVIRLRAEVETLRAEVERLRDWLAGLPQKRKRGRPPRAEVSLRRAQQLAAQGQLPTSVALDSTTETRGEVTTYPSVRERNK
jgi:hypothetical protein